LTENPSSAEVLAVISFLNAKQKSPTEITDRRMKLKEIAYTLNLSKTTV
jgi:hypothetical protein